MSNLQEKRGQLRWLYLAVLVFAVDAISKFWVRQHLIPYDPIVVIPHFFNIFLAYNTGAAFSFLSQMGGWQRWFFCAVALVVSIVIIIWLARLQKSQRWLAASLALILGGALGNLYDRAAYGQVTDFFDFYYHTYHWPTFNVADSAICVGVFLLIVTGLGGKKK